MGDKVGPASGPDVFAKGDRPEPQKAPPSGDLIVGGDGVGGDVLVRDHVNAVRIRLDAGGSEPLSTEIAGVTRVTVDGGRGSIRVGGADTDGTLTLERKGGGPSVELHAKDSTLTLRNGDGETTIALHANRASGWFGGPRVDGDLLLFSAVTTDPTPDNAAIWLQGKDGSLTLRNEHGQVNVELKGHGGSGWFGGRGEHGDILLFEKTAGGASPDQASIWLQGETGDIVLRNADCAEEFDVRVQDGVGPGSVLVLGADGQLTLCQEPYDTRVAGVVSGAAGIRPGIVLGRVPGAEDRLPVGLAGKVVCNVDASFGPIRVGSLLTTSCRPGYAMVASDRERAFGAVIGKAMAPLEAGVGAIPILVGLQ